MGWEDAAAASEGSRSSSGGSVAGTDEGTAGNADAAAAAAATTVELFHFNGLPPAGPRTTPIMLTLTRGCEAPPAPTAKRETYQKPKPGDVDSVVQADPEDKRARPEDHESWRYEIVLAVDDPDVSDGTETAATGIAGAGVGAGAGAAAGNTGDRAAIKTTAVAVAAPKPHFELGDPPPPSKSWRCAWCYRTRFTTMCFGMNEPGAANCTHCGKAQAEAGWSLWVAYTELPAGWQRSMARRHGPKITTLIRTKWRKADAVWEGKPPSI